MVKYSIKTVLDYIYSNDIEDYDIEELEDDYSFMIQVINYTNDKKMYDMCSDDVKGNYRFVRFLINKFNNDLDFICNITDTFIEYNNNKIERIELLIIVSNILPKDSNKFMKYRIILESFYSVDKFNIDAIKRQQNIDIVIDFLQAGFWIILDDYNTSNIVMSYYAKKFIDDIIEEFNINLESDIHKKFNSYKELEDFGLNNYLLNLLSRYDTNLSSYVSCHLELLDDIKKDMSRLKKRWDFYLKKEESNKYQTMLACVHEYIEEHELACYFDEMTILYYIGRELGIAKKIAKYDGIDDELHEDIMKDLPVDLFDNKVICLDAINHYNNIKKIIISILFSNSSTHKNMIIERDDIKINHNRKILKLNISKN